MNCTDIEINDLTLAGNGITLAFEYSGIDEECSTVIDSVCNPSRGNIRAKEIKELILDECKCE